MRVSRCKNRPVVGANELEKREGVGAGDAHLSHVPEIKETRGGTYCSMFVDDPGVLNGHEPAGKRNEPCPELCMTTAQRGFA